jgi:hypothetical protein
MYDILVGRGRGLKFELGAAVTLNAQLVMTPGLGSTDRR